MFCGGKKKESKGKKIFKTIVDPPLKAMSQGADITKVAHCSRSMSALPSQKHCGFFESVWWLMGLISGWEGWEIIKCELGGSLNNIIISLAVSACLFVAKEPRPCCNHRCFCSLSRQQALFHVLAAYSVYNTVSLFVCRLGVCVCFVRHTITWVLHLRLCPVCWGPWGGDEVRTRIHLFLSLRRASVEISFYLFISLALI